MAFFSHPSPQKKEESKAQAIPEDILASVRVMGDENKPQGPASTRPADAPPNLPIASAPSPSSSPSPFLHGPGRAPSSTPPQVPPSLASRPLPGRKNEIPFSSPSPKMPEKGISSPSAPSSRGITVKKPAAGGKWVLFGTIGLIVLLLLGGGGYYYWQNEKAKKELSNQENGPLGGQPLSGSPEPVAELGGAPTLKTLPYALDKPNYLSIDTETAEVSGIKKNIDEVAARLVEGNVAEPIEFIITDKNNNPLAFSRFVYLLDLSLPEALLAQIEEAFSLYLAAESGRTVVGLELALKDPAVGGTLITQSESRLPQQLAPLLYAGTNVTIPATVAFTPSPSRADVRIIRYHNFSLQPNISFDYTVSGKQWFIGTSKEMFRRLLEKAE